MRSYRLGLYEKSMPNHLSIAEKLSMTKQCGFDFLELSVDESAEKLARLDWTDQELWEVRRAIHESGVQIGSICLSGHRKYPLGDPDPEVRRRSMEIMAKAIALAGAVGARIIQLAGYDVYYKESSAQTRALFAANLKRCVQLAAADGVVLAFETMETPFLNTVKKALHWCGQIDSPYLQIYPDAGNITNACLSEGTGVEADLRAGHGRIAALHLKETAPGLFREVPYGQGHVDFDRVVRTAFDLGVRRFLAEFWYVGQEDWQGDILRSGAFLHAFLDRHDPAAGEV